MWRGAQPTPARSMWQGGQPHSAQDARGPSQKVTLAASIEAARVAHASQLTSVHDSISETK